MDVIVGIPMEVRPFRAERAFSSARDSVRVADALYAHCLDTHDAVVTARWRLDGSWHVACSGSGCGWRGSRTKRRAAMNGDGMRDTTDPFTRSCSAMRSARWTTRRRLTIYRTSYSG